MSNSSPSDLATAFRSIPRRQREATGDAPLDTTIGPGAELHRTLAEAAGLLRTSPDAGFIADAINAIPADQWDVAVLNRLRELALEAGHALRALEAQRTGD